MTTNQTIDGVPRKILTTLLCELDEFNNRALAVELCALLDAPPRCPECGYTEQDCREQMDHHLCGHPDPAPVAYRVVFNDGEKSKWEDGAPQSQDLYDVRDGVVRGVERAYAEQPAPVAVVLPEQLHAAELDELEVIEALLSGQGLSNLAGTMAAARQFIDEVTRLNTKE